MSIGVLLCGMGNTRSVVNALNFLGSSPILIDAPSQFDSVTHLILPGVGHFASAMRNIRSLQLDIAIREFSSIRRRPILGICLGMQILADSGTEGGHTKGLGLVQGEVVHFAETVPKRSTFQPKLPHMGWNTISTDRNDNQPLLKDLAIDAEFYFAHSYVYTNTVPAALSTYDGISFPAIVQNGNVFGVQFHPEKSSRAGLALLRNFITI